MKILHFADVHLGMENYGKSDPKTGLNTRLIDFMRSLNSIVKFAIENKIDLVVFAGDAYKSREPDPTYQRAFASIIERISSNDIQVVLVAGNHDLPNTSAKANTLDIFSTLKIKNVYVSREPEILKIQTKSGAIAVVTIPWMTKSQLLEKEEYSKRSIEETNQIMTQKMIQKIQGLMEKIKSSEKSIMVAHLSAEGAHYGTERSIMVGSDIIIPRSVISNPKLSYVALGHIHQFQQISKNPPIIYSGSIERIDFGEEKEDKIFIVADISNRTTQIKKIKLPAREFITIEIKIDEKDDDPTEKVINKIREKNIVDKVVRIQIEIPEEKNSAIRETAVREALRDANFIASINKEVTSQERKKEELGYSDEIASFDTIGIIEKYFKDRKISPSRRRILKDEAQKLIDEFAGL